MTFNDLLLKLKELDSGEVCKIFLDDCKSCPFDVDNKKCAIQDILNRANGYKIRLIKHNKK